MNFKKYLSGEVFKESVPNYFVKDSIKQLRNVQSNFKDEHKILESDIINAYNSTFGGLNKTYRFPIIIDSSYYRSNEYQENFYDMCMLFANKNPYYSVDNQKTGIEVLRKSVGSFLTNIFLCVNNTIKVPVLLQLRNAEFETDIKSNGITEYKSFDLSLSATIAKSNPDTDYSIIIEELKSFCKYLNTINSNEFRIECDIEEDFNNDRAAYYFINCSVIFKTRPNIFQWSKNLTFEVNKKSAQSNSVLINEKPVNLAKIHLSAADIFSRVVIAIYNNLNAYETKGGFKYVTKLKNEVLDSKKYYINEYLKNILDEYNNYMEILRTNSESQLHLYDLILTTSIRENIGSSLNKSWVSCQTWTANDITVVFVNSFYSVLMKKINEHTDTNQIIEIINKEISKPYMNDYFKVTNINALADQIFKLLKSNQFSKLDLDELFKKYIKICTRTGDHSANISSKSVNKSAVSWRYIANAYIVNKDESLSKSTILKRITLLPFISENNIIFWAPFKSFVTVEAKDVIATMKHEAPNVYDKYKKTGFNFDSIAPQVIIKLQKFILSKQEMPTGQIKPLEFIIPSVTQMYYTGDVELPEE